MEEAQNRKKMEKQKMREED